MKTPIVILIRIAFTVISGCNDKNITESNESNESYDLVLLKWSRNRPRDRT